MWVDLLLAAAIQVTGSPDTVAETTLRRLRTTDAIVSVAIRDGVRRSPTFASLVDLVERSDTFVYVVRVHTLPHWMDGCLVHEGDGTRIRYLKVLVLMGTPAERMIVVIAHELQHVREVLEAGIPNDQAAIEALFNASVSPNVVPTRANSMRRREHKT